MADRADNPARRPVFVYFDFDNFKPFNDIYGFRTGDRAIVLFADILNAYRAKREMFVGHIGGDDFFASITTQNERDEASCVAFVSEIVAKFADDVQSLYNADDRERGFIFSTDREGTRRHFPLLTVSASILFVENMSVALIPERLDKALTELKKRAKNSSDHLAWRVL